MARPFGSKDSSPRMSPGRKLAMSAIISMRKTDNKTPLAIMLEHMHQLYAAGDLAGAANRAETCAPYVHPRLAAATISHRDALDDLSVGELRLLLAAAERAAGITGREIEGEAVSAAK